MIKGFRDFLLRGNIVDLAVAVIIGAAFAAVVGAFAKDFIGGIIGIIGGSPDFGRAGVTINGSKVIYGSTLTALISFVITAAVIYFVVIVPLQRIGFGKKDDAPVVPADIALLEEIRDLLKAQGPGGDAPTPRATDRPSGSS